MSAGVTRMQLILVAQQRDRLARAIRRVLKIYSVPDLYAMRPEDLHRLRRAMEITFPVDGFTPTGRQIMAGFRKNRK